MPILTEPLSSASTGAAQISFVNDGKVLVITEKATNKIFTYTVNEWGIPGHALHHICQHYTIWFCCREKWKYFCFRSCWWCSRSKFFHLTVYSNNGIITLVNRPVGARQSAACWVVITNNGKYAYTTNTASNNLYKF